MTVPSGECDGKEGVLIGAKTGRIDDLSIDPDRNLLILTKESGELITIAERGRDTAAPDYVERGRNGLGVPIVSKTFVIDGRFFRLEE